MALLPWSSEPLSGAAFAHRWVLPASGCRDARRLTIIAWSCVALFLLADLAWFVRSPLRFDPANWNLLVGITAAAMLARMVAFRLAEDDGNRPGPRAALHDLVHRLELLGRGALLLMLISAGFIAFSYLATAAALPLRDDALAAIDRGLGFDWPAFLAATNDHPHLATMLSLSYRSAGPLLIAIVAWLALSRQEARLAELLAILSLTFVGFAIGMLAVPTAGAFVHFAPAPTMFQNFADPTQMWPFYRTFVALRDGTLTMIDFATADGIVGFPSFHAALGVVTTWSLRGSRLLWPVAALNATMMVSILPVGGHHLTEVLGGALTGICAIALVGAGKSASSCHGRA